MWRRIWAAFVTAYYWFSVALTVLIALWLALATPIFLRKFRDSVTLPNGMVVRREFDFSRMGRDDLFAADGRTRLVRDVDMICFDDRYVFALAFAEGQGGFFDLLSADARPMRGADRDAAEEALAGGHGCGGYYTGMLGAEFLYDGNNRPFLPPCNWRNFSNPVLQHKDWLLRPCDADDFGIRP